MSAGASSDKQPAPWLEKKVTPDEAVSVLNREADRIEQTQDALLEAGLRTAPSESEMRRSHVFRHSADYLQRVADSHRAKKPARKK
jgi:hypothetical protein